MAVARVAQRVGGKALRPGGYAGKGSGRHQGEECLKEIDLIITIN
jgi:hypothetical protein